MVPPLFVHPLRHEPQKVCINQQTLVITALPDIPTQFPFQNDTQECVAIFFVLFLITQELSETTKDDSFSHRFLIFIQYNTFTNHYLQAK
ncbi:MAG TPA: hypothetical protein DIW21_06450 [Enterococcus sp.]|nr:hypothetical protein [Enterococcus sp.]